MSIRVEKITKNLEMMLRDVFHFDASVQQALVVFDTATELTRQMVEGYRAAIPTATFLDFAEAGSSGVRLALEKLRRKDLVVLVQTSNFRIDDFRIRIELFQRGFGVVEHVHLGRLKAGEEDVYVESLAYDSDFYHRYGLGLKRVIDSASRVEVECAGGTKLVYDTAMESAKLNIGDYSGMENVGGTFPIGEVFSEPKDLTKVNGEAVLWGFGGLDFTTRICEPFKVRITNGILTADEHAPAEFKEILAKISADEEVLVREFGLGLNRAFSRDRVVADITAFERQYGMHMSLGAKHTVYKKEGIATKKTRHHVDVFVDLAKITMDGVVVFENGEFVVSN
jgi:hypothetical protein